MVSFNSYVKLPEGKPSIIFPPSKSRWPMDLWPIASPPSHSHPVPSEILEFDH